MESAAFKFANEYVPQMLMQQIEQRDPVAPAAPPLPEPAPVPLPQQGPTGVNQSAVSAPRPLVEHDAAPSPQKAASFETQLVRLVAEKQAGVFGALGTMARGLGTAGATVARATPTMARGVGNMARGAYAVTKPVTGLVTGGLPGMARGFGGAAQSISKGGVPAALGAGLALYGGYNTLRSPIVADSQGVNFRSPVRIPNMRFRPPVDVGGMGTGGGIRFQKPVKVLW
jgi:hypothetical protein